MLDEHVQANPVYYAFKVIAIVMLHEGAGLNRYGVGADRKGDRFGRWIDAAAGAQAITAQLAETTRRVRFDGKPVAVSF